MAVEPVENGVICKNGTEGIGETEEKLFFTAKLREREELNQKESEIMFRG